MNKTRSVGSSLRRMALTAAAAFALFACGSGTPPAASPGSPAAPAETGDGAGATPPVAPAITHDLVGKDDCLKCHVVGAKRPMGLAETHKGRDVSMCQGCHHPAAAKAGS